MIIPHIPVGIWLNRNEKRIRINMKFIEVQYPLTIEGKACYNRLKTMYDVTKDVPFKETLYQPVTADDRNSAYDDEQHLFHLTPIGIQRKPRNLTELCTAVVCILCCLHGVHCRHYVHGDIRWNNIVSVEDMWYLIDFTFATPLHQQVELAAMTFRIREEYCLNNEPWGIKHDLYQVLKLVEECPEVLANQQREALKGIMRVCFKLNSKEGKPKIKRAIKRICKELLQEN